MTVTKKFTRESRILTPSQFQNIFSNPTRFSTQHFTVLTTPNNDEQNRLGLAIAKKRVKLAVQRNRIKRLVRESFRLNQHKLPHIDMVIMVKSGVDTLENEDISKQIYGIWRKIDRRLGKK